MSKRVVESPLYSVPDAINLKLELTRDGKALSKSELAKLKKSNPSKEELDKLGVKITQEP